MRSLIGFAVKRPITTLMFFSAIILFGLIAASDLDLDFLPDITIPRIVVSTSYPGLPPSEVKELITTPLEDALSSIKGMKGEFSVSREGLSLIELEFHWGTDMMMAAVETREAIDLVFPALPSDTKKPIVLPINPGEEPILWIGAFPKNGDITMARRLAEKEIKTRLQQVEGVGSIVVIGGTKEEIKILVDQQKCLVRGLTLDDISQVLSNTNFDFPAGSFMEGEFEYLVKTEGRINSLEEFGNLFIGKGEQDQVLRLSEIARIRFDEKEKSSLFQFNGEEGVALLIRRKGNESPIKLSQNINSALKQIELSYGKDIVFKLVEDTSIVVGSSIFDLVISAAIGAGIAFFILIIFLRKLSVSLILISSIPISILFTLLLIRLTNGTLNVMSLGGLALGIGMLVDNSVVVLENLRRKAYEFHLRTASNIIEFTSEMAGSMLGSTLTSLVVFIPVIFLPGIIGALFSDLSLAVCYSLFSSFVVAISLVPVLFLLTKGSGKKKEEKDSREKKIRPFLDARYRAIFRFFFRRWYILAVLVVILFVLGFFALMNLNFEFMPDIDTGKILVTAILPPGTTMEQVLRVGSALTLQAKQHPLVDDIFCRAGGEQDDPYFLSDPTESPEQLHMTVHLKKRRTVHVRKILTELRQILYIQDAEIILALPENIITPLLGVKGDETILTITGENYEDAMEKGKSVYNKLDEEKCFTEISIFPVIEKPEIHIYPDREAIARSGFNLFQISSTIKASLDGIYPTTFNFEGREIDVRVLLREEDRLNIEQLKHIQLIHGESGTIHLSDLAAIKLEKSYSSLLRKDRKDIAYIKAYHNPENSKIVQGVVNKSAAEFPQLQSLSVSALEQHAPQLLLTFVLALVLLYLIMGAQFQSFLLPLLLMLALPLSFAGITCALLITGKSVNLNSCTGIIVLLGIAVNNSIILFENYRQSIENKSKPLIAVYKGSSDRLRAILITVLTTVMALIPVAIDPSGTSLQSSMAVAVLGGLSVSTILTLFVIPIVFFLYYRRRS